MSDGVAEGTGGSIRLRRLHPVPQKLCLLGRWCDLGIPYGNALTQSSTEVMMVNGNVMITTNSCKSTGMS